MSRKRHYHHRYHHRPSFISYPWQYAMSAGHPPIVNNIPIPQQQQQNKPSAVDVAIITQLQKQLNELQKQNTQTLQMQQQLQMQLMQQHAERTSNAYEHAVLHNNIENLNDVAQQVHQNITSQKNLDAATAAYVPRNTYIHKPVVVEPVNDNVIPERLFPTASDASVNPPISVIKNSCNPPLAVSVDQDDYDKGDATIDSYNSNSGDVRCCGGCTCGCGKSSMAHNTINDDNFMLTRYMADALVDVIRFNPDRFLGPIHQVVLRYYTLNENFMNQMQEFISNYPNCVDALKDKNIRITTDITGTEDLLSWVKGKLKCGRYDMVNYVCTALNVPFSCYTWPLHRTRGILLQLRKKMWRDKYFEIRFHAPSLEEEQSMDRELLSRDLKDSSDEHVVIKTTVDQHGNSHIQPIVGSGSIGTINVNDDVTIQRGDGTIEQVIRIPRKKQQRQQAFTSVRKPIQPKGGTEYGKQSYMLKLLQNQQIIPQ